MKAAFETVSLDTMIDNHIGERGTEKREVFEMELLGEEIKCNSSARLISVLANLPDFLWRHRK